MLSAKNREERVWPVVLTVTQKLKKFVTRQKIRNFGKIVVKCVNDSDSTSTYHKRSNKCVCCAMHMHKPYVVHLTQKPCHTNAEKCVTQRIR